MVAYLDVFIGMLKLSQPLPDNMKRACDHIFPSTCPIKEGDRVVHTLNHVIDYFVTSGRVFVEFSIRNERGIVVVCVRFEVLAVKKS